MTQPWPRTRSEALARAEGRAVRAAYRALLPRLATSVPTAPTRLPGDLVTFTGRRQLPEQVASLRSLLRWAGVPDRITVVSDGTLCRTDTALLRRLHDGLDVVPWRELVEAARPALPTNVMAWAEADPIGRKLAVELSLPVRVPTMYADADVLFLPGAGAPGGPADVLTEMLGEVVTGMAAEPRDRFLLDWEPYLDERLVTPEEAARQPVNAGFFVLHRPLDSALALDRLAALDGQPPRYHTEQTLVHILMHASGARPLDPARYLLTCDDMLHLHDVTSPARRRRGDPEPALRHYTTPVRQKMWGAIGRGTVGRGWARARGRGTRTR